MKTKEIKNDNNKYIAFLGCSNFPYGFAETQKIILISKSLIYEKNHVIVICNKGVYEKKNYPKLLATGYYEEIEYQFTSGSPYRNDKFFQRNLMKIKGIANEVLLLKKRKKEKKLDCAILSTHNFYSILFYFLLSKIFRFKIILNYVEFSSKVEKKWYQFGTILSDNLFDRYAAALADGVLPISEFIIEHLKNIAPSKKYLKIPGLTDFDRYNDLPLMTTEKYFIFCGNLSYIEIVEFIINAYNKLTNNTIFLYLVISGSREKMTELQNFINKTKYRNYIRIFSKLSEKELFTYYKNALALLIPLRPTFQDIARFPHKTGEYLASGNPVISTNYGEIKYYFKDMENMLLAAKYDVELYAAKMQFTIDNPEVIRQIGISGRKIASLIFDYKIKSYEINQFLNTLK